MALSAALVAVAVPGLLVPGGAAHSAEPPAGAATGLSQPRNLVVGYEPGSPEASSDEAVRESVRTMAAGDEQPLTFQRRLATGAVLLSVDQGAATSARPLDDLAARLAAEENVAYAEPDVVAGPMADPDDPGYPLQWDLHEEPAGMNVPPAWELATGEGVNVAVIDTGHVTHSDLEAQVVDGYDFVSDPTRARDGDGRDSDYHDPGDWSDANVCAPDTPARTSTWHGTHVEGTVAAETGNGQGVASTAYGATVQPVRVLGLCGGDSSDIAEAIIWAAGGSVPDLPDNPTPAQVVNLSLGGKSPCTTLYQDAIDFAVEQGTTVVVAAGNSDDDASLYAPANCEDVITVAASNRAGDRAYFSNHGSAVEITAPGGGGPNLDDNILSTYNTGATAPAGESYWYLQGTSQATPHVSALAALLLERAPSLSPAGVLDAITATARPIDSCGADCGAGLADAGAAVASLG